MSASRFYLPTLGNRTEIEAVFAGLRPELYRRMLREISAQLRLADDPGYDSVQRHRGADADDRAVVERGHARVCDSASRRFAGQPDAPNAPGSHCVSGQKHLASLYRFVINYL